MSTTNREYDVVRWREAVIQACQSAVTCIELAAEEAARERPRFC